MEPINGWNTLDEVLLANPPFLFLGAGFSRGAKNQANSVDGQGLQTIILEN